MSNHTPGPWRTDGWTIIAGNAINIAYTRTAIAEREEEQQANARLIAAAPDLLAALLELLRLWDEDDMDQCVYDRAESLARAAIAKAVGDREIESTSTEEA